MGTMQAAGGARDWAWRLLRDGELDLDAAAAQVPPGANGLICLPYVMGERSPYWNPLARGTFVGLTMPMGKAEMARAVLEGVAMNLRFILDALRDQSSGIESVRLIGGGSRSPLWRQILADCFKLPVEMLSLTSEATSWGAAVAGGVGAGVYTAGTSPPSAARWSTRWSRSRPTWRSTTTSPPSTPRSTRRSPRSTLVCRIGRLTKAGNRRIQHANLRLRSPRRR